MLISRSSYIRSKYMIISSSIILNLYQFHQHLLSPPPAARTAIDPKPLNASTPAPTISVPVTAAFVAVPDVDERVKLPLTAVPAASVIKITTL